MLDRIDRELLSRDAADGFVHGGWFDRLNATNDSGHFVSTVGDLRPGAGAERVKRLITGLLTAEGFDEKHCV